MNLIEYTLRFTKSNEDIYYKGLRQSAIAGASIGALSAGTANAIRKYHKEKKKAEETATLGGADKNNPEVQRIIKKRARKGAIKGAIGGAIFGGFSGANAGALTFDNRFRKGKTWVQKQEIKKLADKPL